MWGQYKATDIPILCWPPTCKSQEEGHLQAQKWILMGFLCTTEIRVWQFKHGESFSTLPHINSLNGSDSLNRNLGLGHKFAAWLTQQAPSSILLRCEVTTCQKARSVVSAAWVATRWLNQKALWGTGGRQRWRTGCGTCIYTESLGTLH